MKKAHIFIGILFVIVSCSFQKKGEKNTLIVKDTMTQTVRQFEITIDTIYPKKINRTMVEYIKNIHNFSKKKNFNESIKISDIEGVTPTTEKEFRFYYNLTYSDEKDLKLFDIVNSYIVEYAVKDKGKILFLYANMAEFVDGEYAEGYHADFESIAYRNKKKFCVIYRYLNERSKWILEPIYKEVCKGVKRTKENK